MLSALADSNGTWGLDIAPIRTSDHQSYYAYSDSDDVSLDAQAGADGTTTQIVTTATAKSGAPHMILEEVAPSPSSPALAAFTASNLTITPTKVGIGETLTIRAVVANTGDLEGTYKATLKINNAAVETREVSLAGGDSKMIAFTTAKDIAGTYTVNIDGLSGSFVVKEAKPQASTPPPPPPPSSPAPPPASTQPSARPINWPVLSGVIAGVIIGGLLVFFVARRTY